MSQENLQQFVLHFTLCCTSLWPVKVDHMMLRRKQRVGERKQPSRETKQNEMERTKQKQQEEEEEKEEREKKEAEYYD